MLIAKVMCRLSIMQIISNMALYSIETTVSMLKFHKHCRILCNYDIKYLYNQYVFGIRTVVAQDYVGYKCLSGHGRINL